MDIMEAMRARHSVRMYKSDEIEQRKIDALLELMDACNAESGLHLQLVRDDITAFSGAMAHYGNFAGVRNYFALIGPKGPDLEEMCGYYGEKLVLLAQMLGLNTCWVGLTFKKNPDAFVLGPGEKLAAVITVGYGSTQGLAHKSRTADAVSNVTRESPDWFKKGVEAALLAPTAINQQKFTLTLDNGKVVARPGRGFFSKMDLGIVKYHFELGSGKGPEIWA